METHRVSAINPAWRTAASVLLNCEMSLLQAAVYYYMCEGAIMSERVCGSISLSPISTRETVKTKTYIVLADGIPRECRLQVLRGLDGAVQVRHALVPPPLLFCSFGGWFVSDVRW
jgi:hypothetical protein